MNTLRRAVPKKVSNDPATGGLPFMMSVQDVSKALGLSISKTYLLLQSGVIPRLSVGRRVIVPRAAFLEWVETNTH